ncbi:Serine/threonine kinase [Xylographa trunciseda]|nr:Serine/threonine kinase [Xylographa trunciseda]
MEEITPVVIPRDVEFEDDRRSAPSNGGTPQIINKADAQKRVGIEEQQPSLVAGQKIDDGDNYLSKQRWALEDFNFAAVLGKGIYSKVMLAERKATKELYAIKIQKKELLVENNEVRNPRTERSILMSATSQDHPFIAKLYATFQTETRLYFVLEYISGGDLMFHVQKGKFHYGRAQFYAAEVCLALKFLHENGILYRNTKLNSIMLAKDGHIKLVDFGLCKEDVWHGSTTKTFCGSSEFMAPEILLDQPYGRPIDWWAFGVLIYQMTYGVNPFRGEDDDEIYDAILSDTYNQPTYPVDSPQAAVDIMRELLTRDPDSRLGSGPSDALEVMNHAYFENINWDDVYHKRVPAPFIPVIRSKDDIRNFEPEFTSVAPVLTPIGSVLSEAMQEEFRGFSYFPEEALRRE